jgi:acetyl-CoA carboxylase biotin carboxyl carrier protein
MVLGRCRVAKGATPPTTVVRGWMPARSTVPADRTRKELWVAEEIRAEMVANVWKVVASEGDEVEDGDAIVILESMKMEIPVVAESSGRVTQLKVSEGDIVQEGDLIAVIG